jgi:hypothetical protein
MFSVGIRRSIVLIAAVTLPLEAQKKPVGTGRIIGETAAGLVAMPIGFAVGYTIGSGFHPGRGQSNGGVALGLTSAVLAPAGAVNWVGNGGPSHGNFAATVGGVAVGYGALYFALPAAFKVKPTPLKIAAIVAAFALPAVGGTVAYNATRK